MVHMWDAAKWHLSFTFFHIFFYFSDLKIITFAVKVHKSLCRIKTKVSRDFIIITKSQGPMGIVKEASKEVSKETCLENVSHSSKAADCCCYQRKDQAITRSLAASLNDLNVSCNQHGFSHNFISIKICKNYFEAWKF